MHPARALHDRLGHDRGQLAVVALEQRLDAGAPGRVDGRVEPARRAVGEDVARQDVGEEVVHPAHRVAERHGAERVAVVRAAEREQPRLLGTPGAPPVLQHHLQGDLDRDGARVREEHVLQRRGRDGDQAGGQRDGRLVGEAAEHDVGHPVELGPQRGVERGVAVAVDRAPPRGHAVDELAPVGQAQAHARGRGDGERRLRRGHRPVGVPDVLAVGRQELVDVGHRHAGPP